MKKNIRKYSFTWPIIFLAPFFICFFLFNLFPILYAFYMSFLDWAGYNEKVFIGIKNYIEIFTRDKVFWRSVLNTLRIGLVGFPIALILGLVFAAILSNIKKLKSFLQTVFFLPYLTTPVAIGMIFVFIFEQHIGIFNKLIEFFGGKAINFVGSPFWAPFVISFMIIWKNTGYFTTMYLAGMTSVSEDIYEAAKIDGASALQTFFYITLPLLKNVTIFLIITSTIYMFQLFDEANLLFTNQSMGTVGGPGQTSLTIVWDFYNQAFGANPRMGYASAMSIVLFFIIGIVSMIGLKLMNGKEE
ncbi:MAG: sugar ABC transporter permease [Lachnospiraceae bacterium]|nr:sugar ABC transporter permease [Lachnospiraceae bacterium]